MSDEIWKPVLGNELYYVSSFGRIKNVETDHILKQTKHNNYMTIKLKTSNGYKPFLVHRIVAKAFIPNPKNLPQINHKDEDGTNNHIENLEWCSAKYNANYGHRNEKNSTKVICLETGEIFPSMQKCAEVYKCSAGGISTACAKKGRYTVKGLHFCLLKDKDTNTIEDIEKIRFDKIHHIKAHREKKEQENGI